MISLTPISVAFSKNHSKRLLFFNSEMAMEILTIRAMIIGMNFKTLGKVYLMTKIGKLARQLIIPTEKKNGGNFGNKTNNQICNKKGFESAI